MSFSIFTSICHGGGTIDARGYALKPLLFELVSHFIAILDLYDRKFDLITLFQARFDYDRRKFGLATFV